MSYRPDGCENPFNYVLKEFAGIKSADAPKAIESYNKALQELKRDYGLFETGAE